MRLVLAAMKHETNTFSPVPTPEARFADRDLHWGEAVRHAHAGTRTGLGAYLELAEEAGAEVVTPVAANAAPSGPVAAEAYERFAGAIVEAVAAGCDGVMLDLHGAMVAEYTPDGEGTLLERIRAAAPDVPVCVNLDLHCNLTEAMVRNCTALIGFKTYPHIDSYETGLQVGRILMRALAGEVRPVMRWGNRPLLAQTLRMGHEDEPMKTLLAMAEEEERAGMLAATVFGGFPLADFHDAGLSAVVVSDGDAAGAEAATTRLLDAAWARRADFVYTGEPLHEAIARAGHIEEGPVILLDHADNAGSGGTQDVMTVVAEIISQGLEDVAVGTIKDPQAVAEMARAGVGAEVTLDLGGKQDMPSIGRRGESLRVTGCVRALTDGRFRVTGPMFTGIEENMGPTAVLDTGRVQIVVTSNNTEPFDTGVFTSVGIDPARKRYLVLKSRIHYRAGFGPLARHTITCDGTGVTTSDNSVFEFKHVRRPIYPLDEVPE